MKKTLILIITVLSACLLFVGCKGKVSFKLKFISDGAVYYTVDTNGEEVIKMPDNPEKTGYEFSGWFWDKDTWQQPFTANSLLNVPLSGDMSVYAKWTDEATLKGTAITTDKLTADGDNLYCKVSNATQTFSFINEITTADDASFTVCSDLGCQNVILSKTVQLQIGDNTYYVLVTNGNNIRLYTVTIRRRPIYTVDFATGGGTTVQSQFVEEDNFAVSPEVTRRGYTFINWDYDFTNPITKNESITAAWRANKYKVVYDVNGGTVSAAEADVTFDSGFTLAVPTRVGHTFTGWYSGADKIADVNGASLTDWDKTENITVTAKWTINKYNLTVTKNIDGAGSVPQSAAVDYAADYSLSTVNNLGYFWLGWYEEEQLISSNAEFDYNMPARDVTLTAKWQISAEMSPFDFTSTPETCTITGLKDTTATEVVIPDYVTRISSSAFSNCSNLTSVEIPSGVTSIGESAFKGCSNLKTVTIPNSVTVIGANAFKGCPIEIATMPTNAIYAVENKNLKTVILTGGTSIGEYAFMSCSNLSSINIPNGVTSIGSNAFYGCSSLSGIAIPSSVTSISENIFYGCENLECISVDSENKNYSSENGILYNKEKTVLIYALWNLKSVTLPDTLRDIKGTFGINYNITSLFIPSNVTSISDFAFAGLPNLSCITVDSNNCYYSSQSGILYNKRKTELIYAPMTVETAIIPETITKIQSYAFEFCNNLKNLVIPNTVKLIEPSAFYENLEGLQFYCPIENATLPASALPYIWKEKLKTVILTNGTSIDRGAFSGCSSLTNITIPSSVTSIGEYAFADCSSLTSIELPNNLKSIEQGLFCNCRELTNIDIPSSVTSIGGWAFQCCSGLTSIEIPNGVTSIGRYAFSYCNSLTSIKIPKSVVKIWDMAFGFCDNLTTVYYEGTEQEWQKIVMNEGNDALKNANIIYNYKG